MFIENTSLENNSLFDEIDLIMSCYEHNYLRKPSDECIVELDNLKRITNNLSKNELSIIINYIINFVQEFKNEDSYSLSRDKSFIYGKGLSIIKLISEQSYISKTVNDV